MSELVISILGTFQITSGSASVEFESNKVRALLAYLAVESDRPHTRDALAALLWPEFTQESALSSLRNALASLRRSIGDHDANPPYLLITRETVQFNPECESRLDAAEVIHQMSSLERQSACLVTDCRPLIAAINSYRGSFLEGFSIPDSAAFEEWASLRREQLEQSTLKGLRWLADYYEARCEYYPALDFARREVALDPWMEEGHCQVMRLLALNGQRDQALRQYQTFKETLSRDLGAEPSQTTLRLYQEILSGDLAAPLPKSQPHSNLPVQTTSFIGREKEIETLKRMILSGAARLVTVTGAGGTGKTRLALRVAEELLEAFSQEICLVELAEVFDPGLVPTTVANSLGLREVPGKPFRQVLIDYLRTRRMLILLDTCEHLVDAVADLVDQILHTAPQVTILVTSREVLRVGGEMPFICPPMTVPGPDALQTMAEMEGQAALAACEAVQLFRNAPRWSHPP